MPAPKRPNTARATETVIRRGDDTAAARLREHGWLAVPPEAVALLSARVREQIRKAVEKAADEERRRESDAPKGTR